MKKIISLLLVFCMVMPLMGTVFAAETATNYYGTIAISRTNSMEWVLATEAETQTFVKDAAGNGYKVATNAETNARWLYLKVNKKAQYIPSYVKKSI